MRLDHLLSREYEKREAQLSRKKSEGSDTKRESVRETRSTLYGFEGARALSKSLNGKGKGNGGVAQLVERLPCKQEVSGSTPLISTTGKG